MNFCETLFECLKCKYSAERLHESFNIKNTMIYDVRMHNFEKVLLTLC